MTVALIVAAGRGARFGGGNPKALVELAGRPLLQWSLDALRAVPSIERIAIALPGDMEALPPGIDAPRGTIAVPGGPARSESVRLALTAAGEGDPVLVHDAARPLLTRALAERVIAAALAEGVDGALAAAPVTDTIKRVEDGQGAGEIHTVTETLDRSRLWAVQTPQVFRRHALERALDVPEELLAQATDDAWLVERNGGRVVVVEAPRENLKITTPLDLALAALLVDGKRA
ncbi:MAG TPA: 2-C-methyl-D-erythritol 4-phosphate cytidylyltransferase [Solirubrobacteraceae bacterium]|nr:2-C-methyl-D-erythritol 4-phosphate cytidylyltransferase [Solirubrobacteraceae bacterium]